MPVSCNETKCPNSNDPANCIRNKNTTVFLNRPLQLYSYILHECVFNYNWKPFWKTPTEPA